MVATLLDCRNTRWMPRSIAMERQSAGRIEGILAGREHAHRSSNRYSRTKTR